MRGDKNEGEDVLGTRCEEGTYWTWWAKERRLDDETVKGGTSVGELR